jgi:hypothetical protein
MQRRITSWLVAGAFLSLSACGGGAGGNRSTAPTSIASPSAAGSVPAGTLIGLTSAETGRPVAGATVVVAGRTYTAGAEGTVPLEENVVPFSALDVTSPGTLDRQTLLRSASESVFSLWPRSSPTGLDEEYTKALVYTWDDEKASGASPLYRLAGTQAALVPSADLQADPAAMAAHQRAADAVNAASGGGVHYVVATSSPSGAVNVSTLLDPKDDGCKDRVLAFTSIRLRGSEISSARIVFCNAEATRDATVTHETGHSFGLGHSPDAGEVMHAFKLLRQAEQFGPRESLVMRLILQRHGGNRFPDNDRNAASSTASGEVTIVCR